MSVLNIRIKYIYIYFVLMVVQKNIILFFNLVFIIHFNAISHHAVLL